MHLSPFFLLKPKPRYNIVVTQHAKKDMTKAEKASQTKLNQRVKFEHAEQHRKVQGVKRARTEERAWRQGRRA